MERNKLTLNTCITSNVNEYVDLEIRNVNIKKKNETDFIS